jgi:DNA repair protein RadC
MHSRTVYTIQDLPIGERPRERLIKHGPAALSEAELLAIILRTGTAEENVVELSKRILMEYNLAKLCQTSISEIKRFRGISDVKACQILACIELANRIHSFEKPTNVTITTSHDVFDLIGPRLRFSKKETFTGLYLDTRNCLIKEEVISLGNLNTSVVHPREIFNIAIRELANSVIIVHNHPSGNPEPSKDDIDITRILVRAGQLIGIPIIDHIIIGDKNYLSMADRRIVQF